MQVINSYKFMWYKFHEKVVSVTMLNDTKNGFRFIESTMGINYRYSYKTAICTAVYHAGKKVGTLSPHQTNLSTVGLR